MTQTNLVKDTSRVQSARFAVEARGVKKVFGEGTLACHALRGIDFQVKPGEFVMLAGPSGSGKTTLLSILGCVLTASGGEVTLFGQRITHRSETELPLLRLSNIGFIFQGHNLLASLTALENVALPLQMRGWPMRESFGQAASLLDRVDLTDKLKSKPHELSGGQRQRVAVARALAGNPPLILADEPTASLDAQAGLHATGLLKDLCRENQSTVIVVTHDSRIFHLADRIVYIEDGLICPAKEVPS